MVLVTGPLRAAHDNFLASPSGATIAAYLNTLIDETGLRTPQDLAIAVRRAVAAGPVTSETTALARSAFIAGRECLRGWHPLAGGLLFGHAARLAAMSGEGDLMRASLRMALFAFEGAEVTADALRDLFDLFVALDDWPILPLVLKFRALREDLDRAVELAETAPKAAGAAAARVLHRLIAQAAPDLQEVLDQLAAEMPGRQPSEVDLMPYVSIATALWSRGHTDRAVEVLRLGLALPFPAPPRDRDGDPDAPLWFPITRARVEATCDLAEKLLKLGRDTEAVLVLEDGVRLADSLGAGDPYQDVVRALHADAVSAR